MLGLIRVTNHRQVVEAWLCGRKAMGRSLSTDGKQLLSYMTPIAERNGSNTVRVLLTRFISSTTSKHLGIAVATAKHNGFTIQWPRKQGPL